MKFSKQRYILFFLVAGALAALCAFSTDLRPEGYSIALLRKLYSSGDVKLWPAPVLDSTVIDGFVDIGSLPAMKYPAGNPYSDAKRDLGKVLFFDPRLSKSGQIACASCHDSELAWGDGRRASFGHDRQLGTRNAMTLLNVGYYDSLFWDGRATSLEDQAHFPLQDSKEMASTNRIAIDRIKKLKGYKLLFKDAFGDPAITFERVEMALATFQRTIASGKSRFDKFVAGDSTRFTDAEVLGLHLFRTKAGCINCHNTPLFSDNRFHNTGLTYYGRKFEDLGKYKITGRVADVGRFRTPSLREVASTGPYMHNGLFPELAGIINLYNSGMPHPERKDSQLNDPLFPVTSPMLEPLHLSAEESRALLAFMRTLTSSQQRETPPEMPGHD